MIALIFSLIVVSFVISFLGTQAMKHVAPRINFVDKPGHRKIHFTPKPLGGGVAIFAAIAIPTLLALIAIRIPAVTNRLASLTPVATNLEGLRNQTPLAEGVLIAAFLLHALGLADDRKALGPFVKLFCQLAIIGGLVIGMHLFSAMQNDPYDHLQLRVLTVLDKHLGMGPWPSLFLTIIWIVAITNAFNFLDNMDGLSAGIGAVCTTAFLITALSIGQLFVPAMLALLLGSLLGFLCFNFPPAKIFMGDSGSMLIGLMLAVLTVRTTYLPPDKDIAAGWYVVFEPVIVLALPLYDLVVVSAIRISRGKSIFVGDNNHFSHRLVARGMSRRKAVLCLYLITAATSIAAVLLPRVRDSYAAGLIILQTILVLCVVALLEQQPLPAVEREP